MGENKVINLFEQAIQNDELLYFALGKGEYFIIDREYGEHSVIQSWINYIIPLFDDKSIEFINSEIEKMFTEIINSDLEINKKSELLLYHLHVYYYLDFDGRIKATNLVNLNKKIINIFENYICILKSQNNSKVEPFENTIKLIKSRGGFRIV